jgi:glucose-1-phosphate adenylyltransferase
VHSRADIDESVILNNVAIGNGAVLRRVILDKNIVVPPKARIGVDHDEDRARGFHVSDGGVVVLGKGQHVPLP